ncbi:Platelet-activating factor acetylhydrolase, isoform II [Actinopolymorpha cephalotaxi]|uniref:Dienelactone hydrolase n=1 Tax=Actinopolymorpha cephalotaxi TaxID=504797 RepID=A0A1I2LES2_9ACTN|nr:alpha/beta hydrolase [Actinopolymorpha cephalotaxi]NYH84920.1 dienelactone hydrolase [Actinopolymorpha cephalotaxi]SFF77775.1 Platelet-activating factor acetylhydrolase, isoform II [Actinopolymorpha cephalotaxi]
MARAERRRRGPLRRALTVVVTVLLAVVVICAAYVGYVAVRGARPVTLPAPTGRYAVGRVTYDWTDAGRADPLAPHPGAARELSVWLWYPVSRADAWRGHHAGYAPGAWSNLHFPGLVGVGESSFGKLRIHAREGEPVANGRFPVVVLEPGLGFAAPQYTTLAENLASHGYLVAGVTPTYSANLTVVHGRPVRSTDAGNPNDLEGGSARAVAAANRIVGVWAADAQFAARRVAALDRAMDRPGGDLDLRGHVDTGRVAYAGHSFGGAASLEACRADAACAGAVDLDGREFGPVVHTGLRAPLMLLGSENSCITGTCSAASSGDRGDLAAAHSLLAASTGEEYAYSITGARHFNFTDYGAYYLAWPLHALLALGSIDGDRALEVQNAYLVAFLDHVVHGSTRPLLTAPHPKDFPEVRLLRHRAAAEPASP